MTTGVTPMRLGILASHAGTTMQAVVNGCNQGAINAQIVIVVSNNSTSKSLERARNAGIPTAHLSSATHPKSVELDQAILTALTDAKVDLVLLCGYMKKLGTPTLKQFKGRILNTHPSLLPKYGGQGFYGRKVHEAVIAAGDSESGVTLHEVADVYDSGKIVDQRRVPVYPDDSAADLESRVKDAERIMLVEALAKLSTANG